jgi:hypothetical protein
MPQQLHHSLSFSWVLSGAATDARWPSRLELHAHYSTGQLGGRRYPGRRVGSSGVGVGTGVRFGVGDGPA